MSTKKDTIPYDKNLAIEQLWQKCVDQQNNIDSLNRIVDCQGSLKSILANIMARINKIPDKTTTITESIDPSGILHDSLGGLSGGASDDYQHLTTENVWRIGAITAREMEDAWKYAYTSYYSEMTWSGTVLQRIDIYTDSGKGTQLFRKAFTYTSGKVTSIVITRYSDSKTLTRTIAYSGLYISNITTEVA